MNALTPALIVLAALAGAPDAAAQSPPAAAKVTVRDAWARLPTDGRSTTAYVTVENLTDVEDRLIGASSPWAERVVLQRQVNEGYNVVKRTVTSIPLKARGILRMRPGGYQLALEGLNRPIRADVPIPLTLRFANGGVVDAKAEVSKQLLGNWGR